MQEVFTVHTVLNTFQFACVHFKITIIYNKINVDGTDNERWNMGRVKNDHRAPGAQVKNTGAQVFFFSILTV